MKQLSKTFLAIFAVAVLAMFAMLAMLALSPKAYAAPATKITIEDASDPLNKKTLTLAAGGSYTSTDPSGLISAGRVFWDTTTTPHHTLWIENGTVVNGSISITGDINMKVLASTINGAVETTGNITMEVASSTINGAVETTGNITMEVASSTINGAVETTGNTTVVLDNSAINGAIKTDGDIVMRATRGVSFGAVETTTGDITMVLDGVVTNNAVSITGDTTIEVIGSNQISLFPNTAASALKVTGNLTIIGSGRLIAEGPNGNIGRSAISCTGTVIIGDGSTSPTITATGGNSSGNGNGGAVGIHLDGNLEIKSGDVNITGGNGNDGGGGDGVYAPYGSVIISGGAGVTITGGNSSPTLGSGGSGVVGNVVVRTTATPVTISGNLVKAFDLGGDGVRGNLTTPTGTIGSGTNITITGGEGDSGNGKQVAGSHFSLSNPPQPTSQVQPQQQQQPARDVIYPTERTGTTRGIYTFSSSGMFSDFSGIWIHGYAIPSSYYTAFQNADGSVSITLADWYVRTLNYNEQYLLHFVFNSGYGITKFYR